MCGRFSQSISTTAMATDFGVESQDLPRRYNIAPTQSVVAAIGQFSDNTQRQLRWMQWGLIPSWAKDPKIGSKLINARAETVAEKPSFRSAFRQRRCLIPADGFYEWQQVEGSRQKQPYFIRLQDERPFAFAGLYDRWASPDGEVLETCTILTTTANELIAPIHDRMPVILYPQDYDFWLDTSSFESERLQALLIAYPSVSMTLYPVSTMVNSPKNDRPECQQPLNEG